MMVRSTIIAARVMHTPESGMRPARARGLIWDFATDIQGDGLKFRPK
jgi:hypothetical protein